MSHQESTIAAAAQCLPTESEDSFVRLPSSKKSTIAVKAARVISIQFSGLKKYLEGEEDVET